MKTFELVLGGHPDKVCDIIAEALKSKVDGKSAIEVAWFNNTIVVGGEVGSMIDEQVVRQVVKDTLFNLGYEEPIILENYLQLQSKEIADIVKNVGAGDNGIFFAGYHYCWTNIIDKLKSISRKLTKTAFAHRYRTDGKFIAQFTEKGLLESFTLNIASVKEQTQKEKELFKDYLISILDLAFNQDYELYINPRGDWNKCGGFADSGLTGRKLACDNSCGLFHQGGGAFFGKDVSKADYSIPIYLHHKAKKHAIENDLNEVELKAHTIIGNEFVGIYTQDGKCVDYVEFKEIMEFAKNNPMEWTGL